MSFEKQQDLEKPEQQEQENTKQDLENFWQNSQEDQKKLDDPKFWNKVVDVIQSDIKEKSKNINDTESKSQIDALNKEISSFCKLWKLDEEQIKQLQNVYKEIQSIQAIEHAEDSKSWNDVKDSIEQKQKDYTKQLLEATEKLHDFMKNNNKQKMKEQQANQDKIKQIQLSENQDKNNSENQDKILSEWLDKC